MSAQMEGKVTAVSDRDPIRGMIGRARARLATAERHVVVLEGEIARKALARGNLALHARLQQILTERIAERDAALKAFEEIRHRPRWELERQLAMNYALTPDDAPG
jgi:hypothetical protein